jgi:membrane-associated phospholipid phosphatase
MKKTNSNRSRNIFLLITVLTALGYLLLNKQTEHLHYLNIGIDGLIPFVPVFAVPYLLFLPVFWLVFLYSFLKRKRFSALAMTIIIVHLISYLFFVFYQTEVLRPQIAGTGLFDNLVRFVYSHDAPYNDFPSLHSALAAVLATYFIVIKSKWSTFYVLFALLVVISTLLIKQHYVVDAVFGIVLGVLVALLTFKYSSN